MERAFKTELIVRFHGTGCDLSRTCPSDSRALRKVFCQLSRFCLMVILNCVQILTGFTRLCHVFTFFQGLVPWKAFRCYLA